MRASTRFEMASRPQGGNQAARGVAQHDHVVVVGSDQEEILPGRC
jgi:hypothetical protein